MSGLRKKLDALEGALGSPSDTAAGLARRLIKESPAPSLLSKTPKLSNPISRTQEIDLDSSIDLFATPKPPSNKRLRHDEPQNADKIFRTPSDAGKPTGLPTLRNIANAPVRKHAASATFRNITRNPAGKPGVGVSASLLNISNKPSTAKVGGVLGKKIPFGVTVNFSQSSIFREGYNGLGGHEKVVMPPAKPKHSDMFKKLVIGGQKRHCFGPSKTAKTPPLPSLDDSIEN